MAPSAPVLASKTVKVIKYAVSKGTAFLRARLEQGGSRQALEAVPVRVSQPIHPLAALRQSRSQQRNFTTLARRITSGSAGFSATAKPGPPSVRAALFRSKFAPFSSPLRPNLTGGAFPRASGGYSLGGGARHFSSTPAAQAQVLHNVSAAVRAFCINGFKAQYDGTDSNTGNKRFRAVTRIQEKAITKLQSGKPDGKGTTLTFCIAPTITSVSPLDNVENTITSAPLLAGLASDFSRSLFDLSRVYADIKRLSSLGSLPISQPNPHTLEVRFPGCDAQTVNSLCDEMGIERGIIREDPEWDAIEGEKDVEMALLFPWAPSKAASVTSEDMIAEAYFSRAEQPMTRALGPAESLEWASMLSRSSLPAEPTKSHDSFSIFNPSPSDHVSLENPWLETSTGTSDAGFDGLRESDLDSNDKYGFGELELTRTDTARPSPQSLADFDGTEGILKFSEVCDTSRR